MRAGHSDNAPLTKVISSSIPASHRRWSAGPVVPAAGPVRAFSLCLIVPAFTFSAATAPASAAVLVSTASNLAVERLQISEFLSESKACWCAASRSLAMSVTASRQPSCERHGALASRSAARKTSGTAMHDESTRAKWTGFETSQQSVRPNCCARAFWRCATALPRPMRSFHRETIDALERALRNMGCDVGTVGLREG